MCSLYVSAEKAKTVASNFLATIGQEGDVLVGLQTLALEHVE